MGYFVTDTSDLMLVPYSYSLPLVLFSVLLASSGAGVAIYLSKLIDRIDRARSRLMLRFFGALAFGGAVWSMQFVGMLAFSLCVTVEYDLTITLVSMLPAFLAALWSIDSLSRRQHSRRTLLRSSIIIGGGVGLMHYAGMEAMQMMATLRFDPVFFALSIVMAVAMSAATLSSMARLTAAKGIPPLVVILVGGVGMGTAISSMHYIGMASARFIGFPEFQSPVPADDRFYLTTLIVVTSLSVLAAVVIGALMTHLRQQRDSLDHIREDYDALLHNLEHGVLAIDPNGRPLYINVAMQSLMDTCACALDRILQCVHDAAQPLHLEQLVVSCKGDAEDVRYLLVTTAPRQYRITGEAAEADSDGLWLIITDATELRKTEQQFYQNAKMATLGEMATGMAHEINQPMNIIKLAIANLKRRAQSGVVDVELLRSKLERMDDQVERVGRLVSHMRTYGRAPLSEFQAFDLTNAVSRACELWFEQLALANIRINLELDVSGPLMVHGNEPEFDQVMMNLISNAKDAIASTGASGYIQVQLAAEGEFYLISIQDTGPGIAAEAIEKLFEPFFTTKPLGEGTGLGCAISYGIVHDMDGNICARNTDIGALIQVRLPRLAAGDNFGQSDESSKAQRNSRAVA